MPMPMLMARSDPLHLQKAPCENTSKAIEMAMLQSKACDVTGITAIACARHGCFAPNSVANLFLGKQQKNVDWGLLQALKTTNVDDHQGAMLIYDIACQYMVHLRDRIGHLLPPALDIDSAIGLFHVHGHKDIFFFRYATLFIPGAGVVAGEILESLWATLNAVTQNFTLSHLSPESPGPFLNVLVHSLES
jgi:Kyakuja-Dileera-Zisupton transposase